MIDLKKAKKNFDRRAATMLIMVERARKMADLWYSDALVAYVAIELQTSLAYVGRSCFLAGMLGGWSAAGNPIRASVRQTKSDVLKSAASLFKRSPRQVPGRDEPAWHSSDHLARVVGAVKPSNSSDIMAALGVYPEARKAVHAVRNFYAHRGEHTLDEIRKVILTEYAEALVGHPSVALLNPLRSYPGPFLERWVWNYRDIVATMCGA